MKFAETNTFAHWICHADENNRNAALAPHSHISDSVIYRRWMEHVPLAAWLVSICYLFLFSSLFVCHRHDVVIAGARSFANDVTNLSRFQFEFTSFKLKYSALREVLRSQRVCVWVGHGFYFAIFLASLKFYNSWVWFNLLCFRFFSFLFCFSTFSLCLIIFVFGFLFAGYTLFILNKKLNEKLCFSN